MTLITLDEAELEFAESVSHYEAKEPGLGVRFRDEVAGAVEWIQRNPEIPRLRPRGYGRVNLHAFPHYVVMQEWIWRFTSTSDRTCRS